MANLTNAITEIERFVKTFKAFEEAKAALDVLANVEQVAKEHLQVKEALIVEVATLKEEIASATKELKELKTKGKEAITKAETQANEVAKNIVYSAEAKAKEIISDAYSKQVAAEAQFATITEQGKSVSQYVKEKEKELEALDSKIVSAKQAINQMLSTVK